MICKCFARCGTKRIIYVRAPEEVKPDCRTCAHVYTDMESYGCKRSATIICCINGDGHVPADPVRLYETGGE